MISNVICNILKVFSKMKSILSILVSEENLPDASQVIASLNFNICSHFSSSSAKSYEK
jgi:hypothetical protein